MPKAEIIGLGRSGIAAARLLNQDGWDVTLVDSMTEAQLTARANARELQTSRDNLLREGVTVKLDSTITLSGDTPDLIVVSPGVPWDIPPLLAARTQNIETIGEIELAWRYLDRVPWVGITGTNGKTTTTALIAAIFRQAGLNAPACGNIGNAACQIAIDKINHPQANLDWIVAELSSYQIESSQQLAPQIGIWTTFSPDHLNRHKTLENYYQIKASLLRRCRQQVLNGDDRFLQNLDVTQFSDIYWTSIKEEANRPLAVKIQDSWIVALGELICPVSLFKMPGKHNLQNLLLAVGAAKLAGINKKAIANAIATFPGVPHRLEYIGTFQGVKYINDSKATNYDAAQVGLASVDAPVILIAGGQAKQGDDSLWIETIKAKATTVLLIGEAAPVFAQTLSRCHYHQYEIVETIEKAIARSIELTATHNVATVLLSPACASFDQYLSFEHRGDHFRELCLTIMKN